MAIVKRECENCEAEYIVAEDDVYIGGYDVSGKRGSVEDVRVYSKDELDIEHGGINVNKNCPVCGSRHTHKKKNEPQRSNLKFKGSSTIVED